MQKIVISLCDLTGRMVMPWVEAGYTCYIVDIQHPAGVHADGELIRVGADLHRCISTWFPARAAVKIGFAFPSCTHTAASGARHFKSKGAAGAAEAFALIARCEQLLKWFDAPWMWEQPVSTSSTYCGSPACTFNPCDFAGYLDDPASDAYSKKTCIWHGGGFVMPTPRPVDPVRVCKQGSWIQRLGERQSKLKISDRPHRWDFQRRFSRRISVALSAADNQLFCRPASNPL